MITSEFDSQHVSQPLAHSLKELRARLYIPALSQDSQLRLPLSEPGAIGRLFVCGLIPLEQFLMLGFDPCAHALQAFLESACQSKCGHNRKSIRQDDLRQLPDERRFVFC